MIPVALFLEALEVVVLNISTQGFVLIFRRRNVQEARKFRVHSGQFLFLYCHIFLSFFGFSSYDIKNNLSHLRLDRQLFLCPQNRCLDYNVTQHNCSKGSVRIAFYFHPILTKFENLFKHFSNNH